MLYASNLSLLPIFAVDGDGGGGDVGAAAIVAVITFFLPGFCCSTREKKSKSFHLPSVCIQFCWCHTNTIERRGMNCFSEAATHLHCALYGCAHLWARDHNDSINYDAGQWIQVAYTATREHWQRVQKQRREREKNNEIEVKLNFFFLIWMLLWLILWPNAYIQTIASTYASTRMPAYIYMQVDQ